MTDYSDFDLDRSMAEAWDEFTASLSDVIASMDESGDLRIDAAESARPGIPFVTFHYIGDGKVRAEAASNAELADSLQLVEADLSRMEQAGWQAPSTDQPNARFWAEASQDDSDQLASQAVIALRDVYGVQHPVFLAPDQLAEILTQPPVAEQPVSEFAAEDVVATVPVRAEHLAAMVEQELTDLLGYVPLRDKEGDWAIRVGSTMVFVRITPDQREVLVFSVVVHDVEGRSRAMECLNDLNAAARYVRFELIRDRVFVQMSVLAHPFVPAHLHQAVKAVSDVADGVDEELARRLRGRTTFDEDGETD